MTTTTPGTSQTARLLALMTKGDNALNARDLAAVDAVHHPDMVAYITGRAEPAHGRKAHAAAMQQILQVLPGMHVNTPYLRADDPARRHGDSPTGKAFDVELGRTTKGDGDQLIVISAFRARPRPSSSPPPRIPRRPCQQSQPCAWPPAPRIALAHRPGMPLMALPIVVPALRPSAAVFQLLSGRRPQPLTREPVSDPG